MLAEILTTTCLAIGGLCVNYVQEGAKHYVVVEKPGFKSVIDVTKETNSGDAAAVVAKVCKKVRCNGQ